MQAIANLCINFKSHSPENMILNSKDSAYICQYIWGSPPTNINVKDTYY